LLKTASGDHDLREGTVVYLEPGESHQFVNSGDDVLRLICLVPKTAYCC
jgi:quercetin dioxygenase-like cupin family protein